MNQPIRILIIRLSALGDVLFTLPAVRALRSAYPQAHIDWVVEDRAASILANEPSIDSLIVYPRRILAAARRSPGGCRRAAAALWHHLRSLRRIRYHVVVDFQANAKSGLHCLLARASRKIGPSRRSSRELSFLTRTESLATIGPGHRIDQAMRLVASLGAAGPPVLSAVSTDRASRSLARRAMATCLDTSRAHPPGPPRPFAVLHPGTSQFGAFKRWAPERYGRLAAHLAARWSLRVLVTWGPGEEDLARRAAEASGGAAVVCPPLDSLLVLGAILEKCSLFVGADSAPLHLAGFAGIPVVALFGPKDPDVYGPHADPSRTVRSWIPCSPCRRRRCPDALCMSEISIDQVARACDELLGSRGNRGGTPG